MKPWEGSMFQGSVPTANLYHQSIRGQGTTPTDLVSIGPPSPPDKIVFYNKGLDDVKLDLG
jgi:hypothetical protein